MQQIDVDVPRTFGGHRHFQNRISNSLHTTDTKNTQDTEDTKDTKDTEDTEDTEDASGKKDFTVIIQLSPLLVVSNINDS